MRLGMCVSVGSFVPQVLFPVCNVQTASSIERAQRNISLCIEVICCLSAVYICVMHTSVCICICV